MEITKPEEKLTFAWQYLYLKELTDQHKPRTTGNFSSKFLEGANIDRCLHYYKNYIELSYELQCRYRAFNVVPKQITEDLAEVMSSIGTYYTPQHRLGKINGAHYYGFEATQPFPEKDDVIEKLVSKPKGDAVDFWTQELSELIHETKAALFKLELSLPRVSYDITLFLTPMVGNGFSDTPRKSEPLKSFTYKKLHDPRIIHTFVEFEDLCCLVMSYLKTIQYALKDLELVEFIEEIEMLREMVIFHDFANYEVVHVTAFDIRDLSTGYVQKLDALLDNL